MKIILVRHAKAMDRIKALLKNIPDDDRPLTSKGKLKFSSHVLDHLKIFSGADLFVSSEFLRARQTLDVLLQTRSDSLALSKTTNKKKRVTPATLTLKSLTPNDQPTYLLKWLKSREESKIVIVSHEPFITNFLNAALKRKWQIEKIKKGAIIVLDIDYSSGEFELLKIISPVKVTSKSH